MYAFYESICKGLLGVGFKFTPIAHHLLAPASCRGIDALDEKHFLFQLS